VKLLRHNRRPRAAVERLEVRTHLSVSVAAAGPGPGLDGDTLLILGTDGPDVVVVERAAGGDVRVTFNGGSQTFAGGLVRAIRAELFAGDDTLTLGEYNGVFAVIEGGAGADSLRLSALGTRAGVQLLPGEVLDDLRDVRYAGIESLTVSTTSNDANDLLLDDDDVIVDQGPVGPVTTINTGDGQDTIDVRSGPVGQTLQVNGGADDDVLTFHAGAGPRANLSGGAGEDRFVYVGTDAADTLNISRFNIIGTGGTASFGSDVESAILDTAGGNDVVEVSSTDRNVHYFVNAGAGNDSITVGNTNTHDIDLISGPVSIDGQAGTDRITVDDASTPFGYAYFVDGGAISRTFTATADYRNVEDVTINGGTGDSGFNVIPAAGTTITLRGGPPTSPIPAGDILNLRPNGASGMAHDPGAVGSGVYVFADRRPVIYSGMETLLIDDSISQVVRRHVFYNQSKWDNNDEEANQQDDSAVATDKQALLPGQAASAANVTSYSRGINGIIIDVSDLVPSGGSLRPEDFGIKVGTGGNPSTWATGPAPSEVVVRRGETVDGASRIMLLWPEGAIRNTWVQVTVPANARTGLTSPDVFYFGNLVGETGDTATPLRVGALDLAGVRRVLNTNATLTSPYDVNRDGRINALDLSAVRQNQTRSIAPLAPPPALLAATSPLPPHRVWDEL
jgi:hypothetical protein